MMEIELGQVWENEIQVAIPPGVILLQLVVMPSGEILLQLTVQRWSCE